MGGRQVRVDSSGSAAWLNRQSDPQGGKLKPLKAAKKAQKESDDEEDVAYKAKMKADQ